MSAHSLALERKSGAAAAAAPAMTAQSGQQRSAFNPCPLHLDSMPLAASSHTRDRRLNARQRTDPRAAPRYLDGGVLIATSRIHGLEGPPLMIADPAASLFHEFLYATIGEDKNGMELTVLSTLARQNLDPWEEAALLSRLSVATALQKLISLLGASPGHASIGERTALAGRLIPLLPNRAAALGLPEKG